MFLYPLFLPLGSQDFVAFNLKSKFSSLKVWCLDIFTEDDGACHLQFVFRVRVCSQRRLEFKQKKRSNGTEINLMFPSNRAKSR